MRRDYPSIRRNLEWPVASNRHLFLFGNDLATLAHDLLIKTGKQPLKLLEPDYWILDYFAQNTGYHLSMRTKRSFSVVGGVVESSTEPITTIHLCTLKPGVLSHFEWNNNGSSIVMLTPKWILGLTDIVYEKNSGLAQAAIKAGQTPDLIYVPDSITTYRREAIEERKKEIYGALGSLPVKQSNQ